MILRVLRRFLAVLFAFFSIASSLTVIFNPWLFRPFFPYGIYAVLTFPWLFLKDLPDPFHPGRSLYWLTFTYRVDFVQGFVLDLSGFALAGIGTEIFLSAFITWLSNLKSKGGLITRENYRVIRHPEYVGIIVLTLGLSLICRRPASFIAWLTLTFSYLILASIDEKDLLKIYGKEYAEYAEKTPFMIPFLRLKLPGFLSNKSFYRYILLLMLWITSTVAIIISTRNFVELPFLPPLPGG